MRNLLLICLSLLIQLSSCTQKDNGPCHPETTTATLALGKDIAVDYNMEYQRNEYNIINGDNILFTYNHCGPQCDDIYDDEWGEELTFMINKDVKDFELRDDNIINSKCFYQEYGAWVRHNQYQVKAGVIKGSKVSENKWMISASVLTTPLFSGEEPKKIEFSALFGK